MGSVYKTFALAGFLIELKDYHSMISFEKSDWKKNITLVFTYIDNFGKKNIFTASIPLYYGDHKHCLQVIVDYEALEMMLENETETLSKINACERSSANEHCGFRKPDEKTNIPGEGGTKLEVVCKYPKTP